MADDRFRWHHEVEDVDTIKGMMAISTSLYPDKAAYKVKEKKGAPYKEITYTQFKEDVEGKSYLISGLHDKLDIVAEYDLSTGSISIKTQHILQDTETGYYILMGCRSVATGYYSFSQNYGMKGLLSNIDGKDTITMTDNGNWARGTDTFALYFLSRNSYSTSDRIGYVTDNWYWKSETHSLQYITSFVRQ